jgi:hypothetical protein
MIARELYRLQQNVEALEKALERAPYTERARLERKLQQARNEMGRMRDILDGRLDRNA